MKPLGRESWNMLFIVVTFIGGFVRHVIAN